MIRKSSARMLSTNHRPRQKGHIHGRLMVRLRTGDYGYTNYKQGVLKFTKDLPRVPHCSVSRLGFLPNKSWKSIMRERHKNPNDSPPQNNIIPYLS